MTRASTSCRSCHGSPPESEYFWRPSNEGWSSSTHCSGTWWPSPATWGAEQSPHVIRFHRVSYSENFLDANSYNAFSHFLVPPNVQAWILILCANLQFDSFRRPACPTFASPWDCRSAPCESRDPRGLPACLLGLLGSRASCCPRKCNWTGSRLYLASTLKRGNLCCFWNNRPRSANPQIRAVTSAVINSKQPCYLDPNSYCFAQSWWLLAECYRNFWFQILSNCAQPQVQKLPSCHFDLVPNSNLTKASSSWIYSVSW